MRWEFLRFEDIHGLGLGSYASWTVLIFLKRTGRFDEFWELEWCRDCSKDGFECSQTLVF